MTLRNSTIERRTPLKRSTKPISKTSKRKESVSANKKKAWVAFSLYIRLRDSLKTTTTPDHCLCVTCGRRYATSGVGCIQAGHWIPGRHFNLLFNEKNCHAQCAICNVWRRGEHGKYSRAMKAMYGQQVMDELLMIDEVPVAPAKAFQYAEIEAQYKAKYQELTTCLAAT